MRFQNLLSVLSIVATLSLIDARPSVDSCWSEKFGIKCCKRTKRIVRKTYDGLWGKENGEWCGLGKKSTRPEDDVPPLPPTIIDLDTVEDPAAECDISDSIIGESLAKEAPFRFGVGLNGAALEKSTTLSKTMRDLIKYQFNSVTYTNLMKPNYILSQYRSKLNIEAGKEDPVLDFSKIVDGLDYCYKNGIHMRGHVLVWHTQVPKWFFNVGYEDDGEYVDAETMEYRLDSFIKQYISFVQFNYPGVVDVWDVVNEAVEINEGKYDNSAGWYTRSKFNNDPNPWYDIFGVEYPIKAFRIARKYALPNVKLVYNDYNTFQLTPISKRQAIINLINILKKDNLIDGIGMQSYINPDTSLEEYFEAIEEFQKTGLEIQITELTIRVSGDEDWEDLQVKQYSEVFQGIMKYVNQGYNIGSVTVFGLQDGYRFYESDSTKTRLFDHDLQKKRVYHAIMETIKSGNDLRNSTDSESDIE